MNLLAVCNLCKENSCHLLFKKAGFNIVRCNNCGLVCVNPRPSDEYTKRLYQRADYFKRKPGGIGYRDYFADEKLHVNTFKREFNIIARLKKGGNLLDVGCAAGFSLKIAREKGWKVNGVEISKVASHYAKDKFGLDVFQGTLEEARYPNNYFDLIIAYSIIEHTPDPLAFLKEVKRIIKDDGIFVLATPDIGSWLGSRRFQYKPREHLYYFNRDTIARMLRKAGMEVFGFRKLMVYRSLDYLAERLKYYFKGFIPLFNIIELVATKTKLLDFSLFMPDGEMVVYARKRHCRA